MQEDYFVLAIHEAITSGEAKQVYHAMREEIQALKENGTWKLVP